MVNLFAVHDFLGENAVIVSDAVAVSGHAERCHGVEEASRESSEAAIAEAGVLLATLEFLDVHSELLIAIEKGIRTDKTRIVLT